MMRSGADAARRRRTKAMREVLQLALADARSVPWKNGRGTTLELAVWPASASFERGDYDWRLSAATVEVDGPFSAFPGCERILTVTRGAGLLLEHGGEAPRARLRRFEPYRFSGDWPTSAALVAGPVADFNVILRRARARAEVAALVLGTRRAREVLRTPQAFAHVLAGELVARVTGQEQPFELRGGDSLWLRGLAGGEEVELAGGTRETEVLLVALGGP
jgi:environmental stress-induced protein Ves